MPTSNSLFKPDEYKEFSSSLVEGGNSKKFKQTLNKFYSEQPKSPITKEIGSLNQLLETSFIVGETHQHISSKKWLMENFAQLKAAGFTTLFMEHLYYDNQTQLNEAPHINLNDRLKKLDNGFFPYGKNLDEYWELYNFSALVKAAHQAGIRIVGIDTAYTYKAQKDDEHMEYAYGERTGYTLDNYRLRSLNYTAARIIERETKNSPQDKWIALVGVDHLKYLENVPGLADITQIPSVFIKDCPNNETSINFSATHRINTNASFFEKEPNYVDVIVDVQIKQDPVREVPKFEANVLRNTPREA